MRGCYLLFVVCCVLFVSRVPSASLFIVCCVRCRLFGVRCVMRVVVLVCVVVYGALFYVVLLYW